MFFPLQFQWYYVYVVCIAIIENCWKFTPLLNKMKNRSLVSSNNVWCNQSAIAVLWHDALLNCYAQIHCCCWCYCRNSVIQKHFCLYPIRTSWRVWSVKRYANYIYNPIQIHQHEVVYDKNNHFSTESGFKLFFSKSSIANCSDENLSLLFGIKLFINIDIEFTSLENYTLFSRINYVIIPSRFAT